MMMILRFLIDEKVHDPNINTTTKDSSVTAQLCGSFLVHNHNYIDITVQHPTHPLLTASPSLPKHDFPSFFVTFHNPANPTATLPAEPRARYSPPVRNIKSNYTPTKYALRYAAPPPKPTEEAVQMRVREPSKYLTEMGYVGSSSAQTQAIKAVLRPPSCPFTVLVW